MSGCSAGFGWRCASPLCPAVMETIIARSKPEALQVLNCRSHHEIELDYADAWRDLAELSRFGLQRGIRVISRGIDRIQVTTLRALEDGLRRRKTTYRHRHLYCEFNLSHVLDTALQELHRRAELFGDRLVDGGLHRDTPQERWQ